MGIIKLIAETKLTITGLGAMLLSIALVMGAIDLSIKVAKLGQKHGILLIKGRK